MGCECNIDAGGGGGRAGGGGGGGGGIGGGNCGAGKAMDKTHKEMGNPLDHAANAAAGAVANTVVPGSGPAVTGALETRDAIRKQQ